MIGFASHFLLDSVPHQEYSIEGSNGKACLATDAVLSAAFTAIIAGRSPLAWCGATGAVVPDLISFSQRRMGLGSTNWHDWAHGRTATGLLPSLAAQAVLSGVLVAFSAGRGDEDA